ncbi:hypothetical protein [Alkalimarinus coralli]|uniref:hypothetical protein n=1 Tax=Alkalimarinus coralli TaxID=2935863 RepID=UPI00202ADA8B|nr:hypothetical protein [Alkalimarinus coralli]
MNIAFKTLQFEIRKSRPPPPDIASDDQFQVRLVQIINMPIIKKEIRRSSPTIAPLEFNVLAKARPTDSMSLAARFQSPLILVEHSMVTLFFMQLPYMIDLTMVIH